MRTTPEQKFERDSEQARRASAEKQALTCAVQNILAVLLDMGPFDGNQQQRLEQAIHIAKKALDIT